MTFKPAQCPTCGGSLQVPDNHATVNCLYCGGTVIVREAIKAAATASIPNLLKLARTAAKSLNHPEAYDYFSRILELDGENSEGWAGKAEAAGWLSQHTSRLPEMINCFSNAIDAATAVNADGIRSRAAHVICRVTTQIYQNMRATLSPAFAEHEGRSSYLTGLGNLIKALDSAHRLMPTSVAILETVIFVCKDNCGRLAYINRNTGQKNWFSLSSDWNAAIKKQNLLYSEKLYSSERFSR